MNAETDNSKYRPLKDASLLGLLLSNTVAAVMAVALEWSLFELMAVYWAQSVIIGIANYFRMMGLKAFSTKNLRMNGRSVPETPAAKRQVANFFALHYGLFHVVYAAFLADNLPGSEEGGSGMVYLALCVAGFAASHVYSYRKNAGQDFRHKKPNLGTLMFYPYLRIIPMHLCIGLGAAFDGLSILFFLLLKTIADAGMHMIEHHLFQAPDAKPQLRMED